MKFLAFLYLILLPTIGQAFDYAHYNRLIEKADLFMSNGDYRNALMTYESALELNGLPQAKNLQNAVTAALKSNELDKAKDYAGRLSKLGVGAAYFSKPEFSILKSDPAWQTVLNNAERSKKAFEKNNRSLLKQLQDMKAAAVKAEHDYLISGRSYADQISFIRTKESLGNTLLQIFAKNGYLSEYKIGVTLSKGELADPIFTTVIQLNTKLPAPPDQFELVINQSFKSNLAQYYKQGLIDERYLSRLGYSSIAQEI